jgi:hypothetical protein
MNTERRAVRDRRSGIDTRSDSERERIGERRAKDRRSGVDRRDSGSSQELQTPATAAK